MSEAEAILRVCGRCGDRVVISYECPRCRLRVCMLCAIETKWKCPKCEADLI